jgi:hypothetical protein
MKHPLRIASIALLIGALTACSPKQEEPSKPPEPVAPAIAPIAASDVVKPFTIGVFQAAAVSVGEDDRQSVVVRYRRRRVVWTDGR